MLIGTVDFPYTYKHEFKNSHMLPKIFVLQENSYAKQLAFLSNSGGWKECSKFRGLLDKHEV